MSRSVTVEAPDRSTGRHIPALDGVRGLAILLVLGCHLLTSNPRAEGSLLVRLFARAHGEGWIGVDLFFVLSGFLITGILYDTMDDRHFFRNFYVRRTLRIFPLYYGFLLLLFLITCFTHDHWFGGIWPVLTYTENVLWRGYLVTDAGWVNINHFWSLATEEQFYLLWPTLVFALRSRRRIMMAAVLGIFLSFGLRLFVTLLTPMAEHPYVVYSWSPARLDGLLSGALLAMLLRSPARAATLRLGGPLLAAGTGCLAVIWWRNGTLSWEGHAGVAVFAPLLLAVTFSGLLLCALQRGTLPQRAFASPFLRFFGRYSYGLYVFHYTIITALAPLRPWLAARCHSKLLAVLMPGAIALLLSVVAAWVSFHFFESHFLRLKDRFSSRSPAPRLLETRGHPDGGARLTEPASECVLS